MLIASIYTAKSVSGVTEIVRDQPSPEIFYKVFFELDMKPLISYLAFDQNSIKLLLSEKSRSYINTEFPIFYKNKNQRSAIDTALKYNQVYSINLMIDYII